MKRETITIPYKDYRFTFVVDSKQTRSRADQAFTKEPETLAWIENFAPDDIFFDIGANIGVFSLFAARAPGVKVYAFEPLEESYERLCENLRANNLQDKVTTHNAAMANEEGIFPLYVNRGGAGSAEHAIKYGVHHPTRPVLYRDVRQVSTMTVDSFCRRGITPTHIKIDVDGHEPLVLDGMKEIIPEVSSVLIEVDLKLPRHEVIQAFFHDRGFELTTSTVRERGRWEGHGNWIFERVKP